MDAGEGVAPVGLGVPPQVGVGVGVDRPASTQRYHTSQCGTHVANAVVLPAIPLLHANAVHPSRQEFNSRSAKHKHPQQL